MLNNITIVRKRPKVLVVMSVRIIKCVKIMEFQVTSVHRDHVIRLDSCGMGTVQALVSVEIKN